MQRRHSVCVFVLIELASFHEKRWNVSVTTPPHTQITHLENTYCWRLPIDVVPFVICNNVRSYSCAVCSIMSHGIQQIRTLRRRHNSYIPSVTDTGWCGTESSAILCHSKPAAACVTFKNYIHHVLDRKKYGSAESSRGVRPRLGELQRQHGTS